VFVESAVALGAESTRPLTTSIPFLTAVACRKRRLTRARAPGEPEQGSGRNREGGSTRRRATDSSPATATCSSTSRRSTCPASAQTRDDDASLTYRCRVIRAAQREFPEASRSLSPCPILRISLRRFGARRSSRRGETGTGPALRGNDAEGGRPELRRGLPPPLYRPSKAVAGGRFAPAPRGAKHLSESVTL
jgi:hypothetical protein